MIRCVVSFCLVFSLSQEAKHQCSLHVYMGGGGDKRGRKRESGREVRVGEVREWEERRGSEGVGGEEGK